MWGSGSSQCLVSVFFTGGYQNTKHICQDVLPENQYLMWKIARANESILLIALCSSAQKDLITGHSQYTLYASDWLSETHTVSNIWHPLQQNVPSALV